MPTPPLPPEEPGTLAEDDDDLLDDGFDARLLDPEAWPDDEEDPATAQWLAAMEATPDVTVVELAVVDDEEEDDLPALLDDDLLETQHDVDFRVESAAEEALPILPLQLEVEIDGRRVPARVDLALAHTQWQDPEAVADGAMAVVMRIRGRLVEATVQVTRGSNAGVRLGLDVLRSRFLLRP